MGPLSQEMIKLFKEEPWSVIKTIIEIILGIGYAVGIMWLAYSYR